VVGISGVGRRDLQDGWARGRLRLGDRQPDRGEWVGRRTQVEVGRPDIASNHSHWQVCRMKAVAGSGRAKEGGRQAGCQAGRKGVVGWEEETSRQMQYSRKKHAFI
jgi:hypothetical protein